MALSKVIWEQVFSEGADLRIQQAFEMLLGEEFGLTDCSQLGPAIDQCFLEDYNQGNEKSATDVKRNCQPAKGIKKVDP
jgi:hypothetical protein